MTAMTLFRRKHRSLQYENITGVLRPSKQRPSLRRSRSEPYSDECSLENGCYQDGAHDRVLDYQQVPISVTTVPCDFTALQRSCSSPSSSSSSALRQSRDKNQSRHKSRNRGAQLRMEELVCIKKELTVIKSQIDELLNSLEQMDPQSPESSGGSVAYSPPRGSVSAADDLSGNPPPQRPLRTDRERQSPETGNSDHDRQQLFLRDSDFRDQLLD